MTATHGASVPGAATGLTARPTITKQLPFVATPAGPIQAGTT